jgi:pimeloyl-ACP methyl ester carboxylesterase
MAGSAVTTVGEIECSAVHGRYVDVPDRGRMYVREAVGPRRSPTLVLLHGLGATAALNWDACIPTLASRFRVLAPDHRGHGRGIRCGGRFRLEDCADDVAALIRQECRGPVLVAGYSMGGPITQLLCRRHPDLVAGMILCATSRDFRGRPSERVRFVAVKLMAQASRYMPALPPPLADSLRHQARLGGLLDRVGGHEHRTMLAAAASLGTFTSREWIHELYTPAVVVATTQDGVVPVRRQLKLAACLSAPVVSLEAGHLVPHTDPQALTAAILAAIDRLPRRARRRHHQVA